MAEETAGAASSTAGSETAGAAPSAAAYTQYDGWDDEGKPIVREKKASPSPASADSASADASKAKTDDAPGSAGKKKQEPTRRPDVEERFKKLTEDHKAEVARLNRELEEARKPKKTETADSSSARQTETKPAEAQPTRTEPKIDDKLADGKPKYANFQDFNRDWLKWGVEQQLAERDRNAQAAAQRKATEDAVKEARSRYADFDAVAMPVVRELNQPGISPALQAALNESEVLADLMYAIGGSEATKADFLDACRTNPGKALRVALLMEQEIVKELAKGKAAANGKGAANAGERNEKGQFTGKEGEKEAPAATKARTPTAPKPPAEVGGRGAPGEDARVSAAKAGDFRTFERESNRRVLAARN